MVRIKLFGVLRLKTGFKETEANVSSVREACEIVSRATGVNGKQSKLSAALQDGDELVLMSPSGGG